MKKMIIASTSTVHGSGYLEYLLPTLKDFFKGIHEILFIPYARPSGMTYDEYTDVAKEGFEKISIDVKGIHKFDDLQIAIKNAKAIFVGGGNTFLLVKTLYDKDLIPIINDAVKNGTPYFGTSAGSNITGKTMQTTNDMPIVFPPSYTTLGLIPFNLNPHYIDPDPKSTHKGETRETRIVEYLMYNSIPVLGLREGSWLEVLGDSIVLKGKLPARLFRQGKKPVELNPENELKEI